MLKDLNIDAAKIKQIIIEAKEEAYKETKIEPEPKLTTKVNWPVNLDIYPGLEGAIACETKIGYINGKKGWLVYQGYNIFDLCAYSSFEEVSYLLLHGKLPDEKQLTDYKEKLARYRYMPDTLRRLMNFPVEDMNAMMALRLATNLMRQKGISRLQKKEKTETSCMFAGDEECDNTLENCYQLIAGLATITCALARLKSGRLPIEPRKDLSHAANILYMINGEIPSPVEEKIMDICLILHADHGLNASTFAALVVASTLSDIYFSIGAGIAALNGPLHGGANEKVVKMLDEIGEPENVEVWLHNTLKAQKKIMGFGHRVYKAYDPRARVLCPLAEILVNGNEELETKYEIALELERLMIELLGKEKGTFPNVDYYSGVVYMSMNIPSFLYTPIFACSRVAGWTARIIEYLKNNRIFRPRSVYLGEFNKEYKSIDKR